MTPNTSPDLTHIFPTLPTRQPLVSPLTALAPASNRRNSIETDQRASILMKHPRCIGTLQRGNAVHLAGSLARFNEERSNKIGRSKERKSDSDSTFIVRSHNKSERQTSNVILSSWLGIKLPVQPNAAYVSVRSCPSSGTPPPPSLRQQQQQPA